ncbi:hypothetical protein DK261_02385 [Pseudomonas sp. RW409]|nr:hypothetical protein DK261_02385 [Pseudomonas sp. RW409]
MEVELASCFPQIYCTMYNSLMDIKRSLTSRWNILGLRVGRTEVEQYSNVQKHMKKSWKSKVIFNKGMETGAYLYLLMMLAIRCMPLRIEE